ncbi:MAG: hypothetical protein ORN24_00585 [Burkholderiales bacterium]|nr:hypothetical protein [Burkholderiales bacterium]
MSWVTIKEHLKNISERDMLALMHEVYQLDVKNRRFFESRFLRVKRDEIIRELKEKIQKNINSHKNLRECRTLINNHKKATGNLREYIELCLWQARCITEYMIMYGGCGEDMENAAATSYEAACKQYLRIEQIDQNELHQSFVSVLKKAEQTYSTLYELCEYYFNEYLNK